jgi:thiamine pyrophosphate-dependent acetolactate synthase large subunit-like protein/nitrite reductase/ring-hydroxylating ferredoxin subunit
MTNDNSTETSWHKILEPEELDEGRVTTVSVGVRSFAVTKHEGEYGCLDNACPHQGGPLGEGSIENGWLRCPWHGYDYSPIDGMPPGGFSDAPACFQTAVRDDGVYVALPPEPGHVRTVSDVIVETLTNWGLTHVFGMVGHSNLGFADAMHKAEQRGALTYIGIRHEGAAAFAASAYGKLTGQVAGCFGIAGPGSTNLLTGLYDAKEDRAPVLAISGQVPSKVRGRGAFQDTDLEAAFSDVAEFSETIQAGSDHAELATLAMKTAIIGRNVAHLILPDEVQHLPAAESASAGGPDGRVGSRDFAPPASEVQRAIDLLATAERPMIVVGHGARRQMQPIIALAELIDAPVATTFKAKGLIADDHPLACGVMGRSGTPVASWFMNECDLLVVFGASFSNHTGIADYKPTIQVDDDPMSLGRFHAVDVPLQGNVAVTAELLSEAISSTTTESTIRAEVAERRAIWLAEKAHRQHDDAGRGIGAAAVMDSLTRLIDPEAVIAVDVGNNTYSFGRYFEASGHQDVLMSGYLGSIGFSLPAAMGAWAAVGDTRQIVSLSGDGGFGQYAMELTTAVKYGMNITHVLLNNGELGKISKEQRAAHWDVWQTSLHNPEFAAFAELCGAKGIRVTSLDQLDEAISEALAHPGPALVEVMTDALLL